MGLERDRGCRSLYYTKTLRNYHCFCKAFRQNPTSMSSSWAILGFNRCTPSNGRGRMTSFWSLNARTNWLRVQDPDRNLPGPSSSGLCMTGLLLISWKIVNCKNPIIALFSRTTILHGRRITCQFGNQGKLTEIIRYLKVGN